MVQKKDANLEILKRFKKRLKNMGIDKLILFGSRAKGNFRKDSDFDILVISKKFKGVKWNERSLYIYLNWKEKTPLEVLCYTPEEFEKGKNQVGIIQEVLKTGIEIN